MSRLLAAQRAWTVPGWAKDALWRRAQAIPSLDLRFADNKSLTDAVTGASLITFTRASSGTYVDSAGVIQTASTDVPRFDHNPTTGESLGLLVEEQRTNLLLRSEEFSNATWAKDFTNATADAGVAPNGTTTADKIAEDSSNNFHAVSQYVSGFASGAIVALSIYAKASGRTRFRIQTDSTGGTGTADFDLSAGTATSGTGVFSGGSISNMGNGWYRCSVLCTTSAAGAIGLKVILAQTTYGTAYTGDGTSGVLLWGAQLEAGAFPTSYIPTTTATATRSADVASITGTAFSSWYRQDEGTVFASVRLASLVNTYEASFTDNSNNNHHFLRYVSGQHQMVTKTGGVDGTSIYSDGGSGIAIARNAYGYKTSSFAISANGIAGAFSTTTANTVPTVDRLNIGMSQLAAATGNLHISRLTYWPTRLPNSTLQAITL